MPFGGSATIGVGSSHQSGYRRELLEMLREQEYDVQMVGSRRNGTNMADEDSCHEGRSRRDFTLDRIAKKGLPAVRMLKPNLFLINAGSTDCVRGNDVIGIGRRMEELMLNRLWRACPGALVVLSTLIRNRNPYVEANVCLANHAYGALVERLAKQQKRIVLADMHDWYKGPELEFDVAADGINPNDTGYTKMAHIWMAAIEEARENYLLPTS